MELRLWSSRFLMCDWKCMCVYVCLVLASLFCFDSTKTVHAGIYLYFMNLISSLFVHSNLLRSWKCPDPNRLWLHSGSPGMWPAPSPAPPLCWQTTSLQRETQSEERSTEKDRVNISTANNRQGPNDSSKNHSHLVIYSKQWELHVTVGHFKLRTMYTDWASICRFSMSLFNTLDVSVSSWQRDVRQTRFTYCDNSHHYWTRQWERRKTLGRPKCWSSRQNVDQHKFEEDLLWQLKMYLSRPMGVFKKVLYLSLLLIMKRVYCCYFGQMSQS